MWTKSGIPDLLRPSGYDISGDKMSQRQNVPQHYAPPQQHNVPTYAPSPATFCPTFSIWIPTPRAKLVRISGISGIYLGQFLAISLAYIWENHCSTCIFEPQIVPSDKMSHFLPSDKIYQLMHLCTGKLWKVVGTFCRLSHFLNLKANTLGKVCAFSKHVLDISWLHSDYILATFRLHSGYIVTIFWLQHKLSQ